MYKVNDVIKESKMHEMRMKIGSQSNKKFIKTLKEGDKLFVDPQCKISRSQLKKYYGKTNPIVTKLEDADVLVLAKDYKNSYASYYHWFTYIGGNSSPNECNLSPSRVITANKWLIRTQIADSSLPAIYEEDISFNGQNDRKMDKDEKDKISQMLSSSDKEMNLLGIRLLTSFSLSLNEEEYVLCLAQARRWNIPNERLLRGSIKKLKTKYVNLTI